MEGVATIGPGTVAGPVENTRKAPGFPRDNRGAQQWSDMEQEVRA